ncbi:MAG: hypothetical protein NC413_13040 [Muribaculum sp.]|nr:hypothetical protein [Muribaculum sp.]
MRIVLDYLAEGEGYRSDRPVVHKEALVKMLRVLSGDNDVTDTEKILQEMDIREEDEISMCELFDQYIRKGRTEGLEKGRQEGRREGRVEGIMALIGLCKDLKVSFEETAERVRNSFHLEDAEVQENMRLYW